jgi:integrase
MPGSRSERRPWGAGTLYQRSSDGRWVGAIRLRAGGRRYVTGTDRNEVERRLKVLERSSISHRSTSPTVSAWLARWLNDYAAPRLRPRTLEGYRAMSTMWVEPSVGAIRLVDLHVSDVERMVATVRSERSPQTARHALKVLRSALTQAVRSEIVDRNVAALVKAPKVTPKPFRPLTLDEARAFLEFTRKHPRYPLYALAITTGMRQGEILGLRWPQVNLTRGTITINATLRQEGPRHFAWDPPKTARSARTLPLAPIAVEALREQKARATSATVVFARPDGRPLPRAEITREFQEQLTAAGLPKVRFHDMRHAAAALMLEESAGDLRLVSSYLGHSSIATTVDIYGGMAEQARERAASAMGRLFPVKEDAR